MKRLARTSVLSLLLISLVSAVPNEVHAQLAVTVVNNTSPTTLENIKENTITAIKSTLSAALAVTNNAANVAKEIKSYVLDPIAFIVSGNLLKSITSSILGFVGGANGTGKPLYVANLRSYLQNVGDVEAYSFLNQFQQQSNSPFAAAIVSSLRANYLQSTSLAGFFAANKCTLSNYSPNINQYVAGDWSQGGWLAWFGLTTQDQNNPYTYYFIAKNQLVNQYNTAQAGKLTQANWGQGILSWCGASGGLGAGGNQSGVTTINGLGGAPQPGDPCTRPDGTEGTIQTPGSIIKDFLSHALTTLGIDKNNFGDISASISGIMQNIGTIFSTINMASSLFGGSNGLQGFSGTPTTYTSPFQQYLNNPSYMGYTVSNVAAGAGATGISGTGLASRANDYGTAWQTIGNAAAAAATNLTSLASSCSSEASAANTALTTEVTPIENQVSIAATTVSNAQALASRVSSEGASGSAAYASDFASLATAAPTTADVLSAQNDAQSTGGATANPNGSLNVGGGSLLDQMNLLSANAQEIQNNAALCPPPSSANDTNNTIQQQQPSGG